MNPKIMVVDDEHDLREMLAIILQKEGFEVEMADCGEDFLNKVETFQPDIITLDVMMPGLTTSEILTKIKERNLNLKIILLSVVRFSEEEKERIFSMGNVIDYITKPFDLDIFISTIQKYLPEIKETG